MEHRAAKLLLLVILIITIALSSYEYDTLGTLYWPMITVGTLLIIMILHSINKHSLKCVDRIPLDVVWIDNEIDRWRGKLCSAQHDDDVEMETIAMIHIDTYQSVRVIHGLEPLTRVI